MGTDASTPAADDLARARMVKEAHEGELMALPDVVAVGIGLRRAASGEGEAAVIVVSVARTVPPDLIPTELDGVPVEVQLTGPLMAGDS